jgi:type II secretory pathway pseudopilin PulG
MVLFSAAVAVATPAYLGFQDRKANKSAQTHLAMAVQMAEAYRTDHGSYLGMDAVDLGRIDPRLSPTVAVAWVKRGGYCLTDNVHGKTWSIRGPYRSDAEFAANETCD